MKATQTAVINMTHIVKVQDTKFLWTILFLGHTLCWAKRPQK